MSKFKKFMREINEMHGRDQDRRYAPTHGLTPEDLQKALHPKSRLILKAAAHARRLSASIKETLKSDAEKKQLAQQARIGHQRVVLQKLSDLREQVKQAVIAGELTGDEAATLENTLNKQSTQLYDKHLALLTESGARKVQPAQAGGGR